jgi:uroporphyrinogen-III synthase
MIGGVAAPDGSWSEFAHGHGPADDPEQLASQLAHDLDLDRGNQRWLAGPARSSPRVLVTRAARQAGELLASVRAAGLDPVLVPTIAIEIAPPGGDLDRAAGLLQLHDWVVVTSPNGARAILTAAERILTELEIPRWAAIGDATRAVLEGAGIEVAFQPSRADARSMVHELPVRPGDKVAIFRGDLAGSGLAATLRERGAIVDDVVAYRTREAPEGSRRLLRDAVAAGPIAAAIFTSGSTVRGLVALAAAESIDIRDIPAVCIGDTTADEAGRAGFREITVASDPNPPSIAASLAAVAFVPSEMS